LTNRVNETVVQFYTPSPRPTGELNPRLQREMRVVRKVLLSAEDRDLVQRYFGERRGNSISGVFPIDCTMSP